MYDLIQHDLIKSSELPTHIIIWWHHTLKIPFTLNNKSPTRPQLLNLATKQHPRKKDNTQHQLEYISVFLHNVGQSAASNEPPQTIPHGTPLIRAPSIASTLLHPTNIDVTPRPRKTTSRRRPRRILLRYPIPLLFNTTVSDSF